MYYKNILFLVLFIVVDVTTADCPYAGHTEYSPSCGPNVYMDIEPKPGFIATVCVSVNEQMIINLQQSDGGNVYSINVAADFPKAYIICYTFVWKDDGMAIFVQGRFQKSVAGREISVIKKIVVPKARFMKISHFYKYPTWALTTENDWRNHVMTDTNTVPITLHFGKTMKLYDFMTIVIYKVNAEPVTIKFHDKDNMNVPMAFTLVYNPKCRHYYVIMTSYWKGDMRLRTIIGKESEVFRKSHDIEHVCDALTITFHIDRIGWSVTVDGDEHFFFYHQVLFSSVDSVTVTSALNETVSWNKSGPKILYMIHGPIEN